MRRFTRARPVRTGLWRHASRGMLRRYAPSPSFAKLLRRVSAWSLPLRRQGVTIHRARKSAPSAVYRAGCAANFLVREGRATGLEPAPLSRKEKRGLYRPIPIILPCSPVRTAMARLSSPRPFRSRTSRSTRSSSTSPTARSCCRAGIDRSGSPRGGPFFASGADDHFVLDRRLFLSFFRSSPL